MAAIRTLLSKYWILIVILLWVIAWVNRDRLLGIDDVVTEPVPEAVSAAAERPAPPAPAVVSAPDASATGLAPETPAAASRRAVAEVPAADDPVVPELGRVVEAPAPARAASSETPGEVERSQAADLLAQTRLVYRTRGPRGAAEALERGLRDVPADAPERADLLGELGNLYISAGDMPRALAAYDQALIALPKDARAAMISRLSSVYDRFHPMGRSHLEQFR